MRASLLCLLVSAASTLVACGGAIAPQSDDQQSTTAAGAGKSAGGGSSGTTGSDPGTGSSSGTSVCTPGAYVFCRCADRSEGTKLCRKDGTFDACSCDTTPPEPPSCSYPPTKNPPGCPASYSYAYQGQPCATLNLDCSYPGAGDFDANGCAATAGLWCRLGPGGSTTAWFATQ